MCALMVLGMSIYNVALMEGWSGTLVKDVIIGYVPAFVVAFILDVFVVGKVAKGIAHKLVKENDPMIKKSCSSPFYGDRNGAVYVLLWRTSSCRVHLSTTDGLSVCDR